MQTFIDKCLAGDGLLEEIDDYVDQWHESSGSTTIFEFLGLTEAEYASWVVDPDTLRAIVKARRDNVAFDKTVMRQYSLAARSADPKEAKKIDEWLRRTGRI